MILILEDDADREQYRRVHPLNPEFLNPDTMRPATVWISPEAYLADERERMEVDWNGPARADIRRALRADLRDKVEALYDAAKANSEREATLGAVLDLIDGSSDD